MQTQYPEKIKVYEYLPKLYAGNLSKKEYEYVCSLPKSSPHLLCNYYNYALSKCSYRYVMKIDSDQVYFSQKLNEITQGYRGGQRHHCNIFDYCAFALFLVYELFLLKFNIDLLLNLSTNKERIYEGYFKVVQVLIQRYKIPVSLSGTNLYIAPLPLNENSKSNIYITLGKFFEKSRAILTPFNGIGDHPIFRLSSDTYFVPFECADYDKVSGQRYSVIEKLSSVRNMLPVGVCWAHFSSNRLQNASDQENKFKMFPDYFLNLRDLISKDGKVYRDKLFKFSSNWGSSYEKNYWRLVSFSINKIYVNWLSGFFSCQGKIGHNSLKRLSKHNKSKNF